MTDRPKELSRVAWGITGCDAWALLRGAIVVSAMLIGAIPLAGTEQDQKTFLVAGMRVAPTAWDKEGNLRLLEKYARQASEAGARLLVTGEGFLDGYVSNARRTPGLTRERLLAVSEPMDGPMITRIQQLAVDLDLYLSVGFAERRGNDTYNSVVLLAPDGSRALHYSKTHTSGEPFHSQGTRFPVASTDVGRVGALICFDRRFPETARILAIKGAQLILIPAFGTDDEKNEALLRTRAWENSVYVVYVKPNQVLIINPGGRIIARDKGEGDELVFGRIELDERVGTGDILLRNPEIYGEILRATSTDSQTIEQ